MFVTLVGMFVFSVMLSELLMTYAISCPLWSSVYECQRVECAFTSPVRTECGMFVMYCMQCCMSMSAVLRRYINVCNCDMFSVVNVYLDNLKFCVVCIIVEGMSVVVNVMMSLMCVLSPLPSCLVQPIGTHGGEVMHFGCFCFRGELGFRNCADICMCVVNKQFELLKFVFDSVYVDLQYDEISLTFTAGSVVIWSSLVVSGLSVRLS